MRDGVREGLERFLSERADESVVIAGVHEPTGTGFSADTFVVDIESVSLPGKLVVQAAPAGPGLFDDHHLERSFRIQHALAATAVPVAPMRWLCEDTSWIGTPFLVMDFVDGLVPPDRPPYHVAGWLSERPEASRRAIWLAGVDAMADLHLVDGSAMKFLGAPMAAGDRLNEWRAYGEALGPDAERSLLAGFDALTRQLPAPTGSHVHWGDAKLGNMMFRDDGVVAVFDWELCGRAPAEEDVAHWLAVDWLLGPGLGNVPLFGLPSVGESIEHYERRAGCELHDVQWWFVFALIRMGLIFQRAAVQRESRRDNVIVAHLPGLLDGSVWDTYAAESRQE